MMITGEIEEVIADPIQKGQFAPLSDSLCWAILELTSLGQFLLELICMWILKGDLKILFERLPSFLKER